MCVWSLGGPQLLPGALQSSFILWSQCSRAFTPTDSTTPSLCLSCVTQSTHTHTALYATHYNQQLSLQPPHTHTSACKNTHTHCYLLSNISFIKLFGALRSQTFHVRCYIFRGKLTSNMLGCCGWLSCHCYLVGKVF